jgi:hypothetical protein
MMFKMFSSLDRYRADVFAPDGYRDTSSVYVILSSPQILKILATEPMTIEIAKP